MVKLVLPIILIMVLVSCKSSKELTDYYGQTYPDTIPVIFAPDIVSIKGRLEHGISFTPDTKELAFGILNKDDFGGKIYHAKKSNNNWLQPIVFEPLKDSCAYLPYFSPDGKQLLFAQSTPDTTNYLTDIWVLHKIDGSWTSPKKVNDPINTSARESTACMTLDNTIYFSSNRDGNGLADIYVSSLENGKHSNIERIDTICSDRDEESVFVSPYEDYIIFSRYETDKNGPDLFISYRNIKGNWTTPRILDAIINTSNWERRPFVSLDNKFLFFTKLTMSQSGIAESDIYWVNTQKIFKPFVFHPIPEKTIKIGQQTAIKIPSDHFKDIDTEKLEILVNNDTLDWAKLDKKTMTLFLNPNKIGKFELIVTAIDQFSNKTNSTLQIIVEN